MAIRLIIEGPQAYVTPSRLAAAWGEQGRALREQRNPHGAPLAPQRVRPLGQVEALAEAGKLRREQVQAGLDIRAYWQHWTASFFASVADHRREVVAPGAGGADPISAIVRANRYRPWAEAAEAQRVRGELTVLQVTLDLVVRDWSPTRLGAEYRLRKAAALYVVQQALLDYARRAGWVKAREAA
jgi:hypothetical protein